MGADVVCGWCFTKFFVWPTKREQAASTGIWRVTCVIEGLEGGCLDSDWVRSVCPGSELVIDVNHGACG